MGELRRSPRTTTSTTSGARSRGRGPVALAAKLRRSHFLFLGYAMADWNLRVVLNRLWGDRPLATARGRSQPEPKPLEREFWRRFDVDVLDVELDEYVELARAAARGARERRALRRRRTRASRRSTTPSSTRCSSSAASATPRSSSRTSSPSRLTVLYGPSGVGKTSLLSRCVARALRQLPETAARGRLLDAGATTRPRRSRGGCRGGGHRRRARSSDVARRARRPTATSTSILDQVEEYFLYHAETRTAFAQTLAERSSTAPTARERPALAARGRAREARSVQGARSRACSPTRFASTGSTAPPARAAIVGPLERCSELDGRGGRRSSRRSSSACSTRSAAGRIELGRAGGARRAERRARARIEAPYLQLVMQRLWDVERAAARACSGAATLDALGGAEQIVARALERALDALRRRERTSPPRSSTISSRRPARRSRTDVRPRRVRAVSRRREVRAGARRRSPDHRILRRDEAGGRRSSTTSSRAPCSAGRAVTTRSGRSRVLVPRRAPASPAWFPRLRRARRARPRHGARRLRVLATERRARAGARREGRAAGRERARRCWRAIPELGLRARARGGAAVDPTLRAEDALRQALDASRVRGRDPDGASRRRDGGRPDAVRGVLVVGDDGVARARRAGSRAARCAGRTASTAGRRRRARRGRDAVPSRADSLARRARCGDRRHRAVAPVAVTLPGVRRASSFPVRTARPRSRSSASRVHAVDLALVRSVAAAG